MKTKLDLSDRLTALMAHRNWNADYLARTFHRLNRSTHRSAWALDDRALFYGNDGFGTCSRTRRQVELLLDAIEERGWAVDGFGLSAVRTNHYTWCIQVQRNESKKDEAELRKLLWDCWFRACDEDATALAVAA